MKIMIQVANNIRTGLATTGLIGAGIGIGVVFGALTLGGHVLFGDLMSQPEYST